MPLLSGDFVHQIIAFGQDEIQVTPLIGKLMHEIIGFDNEKVE